MSVKILTFDPIFLIDSRSRKRYSDKIECFKLKEAEAFNKSYMKTKTKGKKKYG